MINTFYEKAGPLLSPGDVLGLLPYARVPKPIKVARKYPGSLRGGPAQGDIRLILEVDKDTPTPPFDFESDGEEILLKAKMARAVFLTWGSEVDSDRQDGGLQKKDWLIVPIFPLDRMKGGKRDSKTGEMISFAQRVEEGRSPRFCPLPPLPGEDVKLYVDFRRICPIAATHFDAIRPEWHLGSQLWNHLFNHLMWFFTRRKIFFGPVSCPNCSQAVDRGVFFEGQAINPGDR